MNATDTVSRANEILRKVSDTASPIFVDALLDAVSSLVQDCSPSSVRKNPNFKSFVERYEEWKEFIRRERINKGDFELIKVIGRGAYGKVSLVRNKETREVLAMKELSKAEMIDKGESACIFEERQIMAMARSEWVVALCYSFQDYHNLYMVMEYVPGGNLLKIMDDYELTEKWTKFYIAEVAIAVSVVHSMGYVHRDIKPENILIDRRGHVKLADFGTCAPLGEDGLVTSSTAVGTPDYISPEVLQSESQSTRYGIECDYWSIGVLLYEVLYSDTPFYADSLVGTYAKIMDYRRSLQFPPDIEVSEEAKQMIRGLLTSSKDRLGKNGLKDLRNHRFFQGTSWTFDNIRDATPPVVPEVSGDADTQYFDEVVDDAPLPKMQLPKEFKGNNIPFIGFTYNKDLTVKAQCFKGDAGPHKEGIDGQMDKIGNLEKELNKTCQQLREAEERATQLGTNMGEATQRLAALSAENGRMKAKLSSLRDSSLVEQEQVDSMAKQLSIYKETIAKLQRDLDAATSMKSKKEQVVGELEGRLGEAQQKLMENNIILQSTESQLKLASKEKDEFLKEKHNLQENCKKSNSELAALKESSELLRGNNEALSMEVDNLKSQVEYFKSQQSQDLSDSQLSSLQKECGSLQEKLINSERTIKQIKVLNASEKARRVVNMKEIEELKGKLGESEEGCSRMRGELFECWNKINELKKEVEISQRKLMSSEAAVESRSRLVTAKEERIREMESTLRNWEMEVMGKDEVILSMERAEMSMKQRLVDQKEELEEVRGVVEGAKDGRGQLDKEIEDLRGELHRLREEKESELGAMAEKNGQLEKSLREERIKKEQVINKLAEISQLRPKNDKKGGNAEVKLKKKEMEYKRLEQQLGKMREQFEAERNSLRKKCEDLQNEKNNLELEVSSSRTLTLPSRVEASSVGSLDLDGFREGILYLPAKNIKRQGWNKRRVILREDKLSFLAGEVVEMVIDVGKMYLARAVNHRDVYRAKESDVPKIFQIIFANEGVMRRREGTSFRSVQSAERATGMTYLLGHEMVSIVYRKGDVSCDFCHRGLSSLFNPAPALQCRLCNLKVHREHIESEEVHTPCTGANLKNVDVTELFLMAPTSDEQKTWIRTLSKLINEKGFIKTSADNKSLTIM